jgi:endonuclease/exonuclease/phosphatase family metal-dependent hydrolase
MRIATFNVENLDEDVVGDDGSIQGPSLEERIKVLQPQLLRLNADILCLQEVHGQETENQPRTLKTLAKLLDETPYSEFHIKYTKTTANEAYDKRNLVIVSRYPFESISQIRNDLIPDLMYKTVTAIPPEASAKKVSWERPILHAVIDVNGTSLHVLNLHLKSRLPTRIHGQTEEYHYKSVNGWAEGYFISSMKRVGQALEARMIIDEILENNQDAYIIVAGDFNAEPGEIPVETIVGRVENTANPELGFRTLLPCSNSIPKESRYTHLHEGHGNLLDHMVISRAMMAKYISAEIHNEGLHDESISFATDKKYPESDHAPFVVEFAI